MAIGTAQTQNDVVGSKFGLKILNRPVVGNRANLPTNLKELYRVENINIIDPSVAITQAVPIMGSTTSGFAFYLGPDQFRILDIRLIYKLEEEIDYGELPAGNIAGYFGFVTVPQKYNINGIIAQFNIDGETEPFDESSWRLCPLRYQDVPLNVDYIEARDEGVLPHSLGTRDALLLQIQRVSDDMFAVVPSEALFDFVVLGERLSGKAVNRLDTIL
jgi:hypothetical protein